MESGVLIILILKHCRPKLKPSMTAQVFHNILDKITSADARVPFPQGKGTKGCRGPARIPCGTPAPGPPADKRLASVESRGGAPDGVPSGSALTAPLKTFRFQRGPVLRGGKVRRGKDALCAWNLLKRGTATPKASPERVGARFAGGGVPFSRAARSRRLCQPP